ncbi:MAG: hypothetical protein ABIQ30_17575 [Devosia sp.]
MFIGHLAGAEILHAVFPQTPVWVSLVGVGFPDLLWGVTVLAGIERAQMGTGPLQRDITFTHYPYSHSLILTNLIALIPALALVPFYGWQAAIVFLLASISHWLLDVIVHIKDLPVLGFGKNDTKVGLGLWRHGPLAFAVEYAVVVAATLLFVPADKWLWVLVAAAIFHAGNANSFFGFTKANPFTTPQIYAMLGVVSFAAMAVVFSFLL